jgi:molybdate/tungstate transport system permease protein
MKRYFDPFLTISIISCVAVLSFILFPLIQMMFAPSWEILIESVYDPDIQKAICLSLYTSGMAVFISFLIGTPFAYLLARKSFFGKRFVEGIIDLPIVIPHPVIGIAILSIVGKQHWIGMLLHKLGVCLMGSISGIVVVLTFVGMPFYINTVKNGFEAIPVRLENVSRSLGASFSSTFFRITLPLAWRSIILGIIMCFARAISEFGAVIVVAYHPMIAPVLIYERFTAFGLKYSQPIAVLLILVSLMLFVGLRFFSKKDINR